VLVTRPAGQAEGLCEAITAAGGRPVRFPALELREARDPEGLREVFRDLSRFSLAVFVSANAVDYALPWFRAAGGVPAGMHLAAVGKATARALTGRLAVPDLVPETGFDSEALLGLAELHEVTGKAILILRGEGGRALLGDTLRQRGAEVVYAEVYRRALPEGDASGLLRQWERVQVVTATSQELLENLLRMFGAGGREALMARPVLVISSRLAAFARELGFREVLQAPEASDEGLVVALDRYVRERCESGLR
jgi:uroporphyrinogen-III synthase